MLANEISELCREVLHMRNHYPGLKTASDRASGRCSRGRSFWAAALAIQITAGCAVGAQVSSSAYRALGQADLRRNGVNGVQGLELNSPLGVALDRRGGQTYIYIADTLNSRVLAWPDVNSYQAGDPPALVLGQRGAEYSIPL